MNKIIIGGIASLIVLISLFNFFPKQDKFIRVLVFSKTAGYRHESIAAGQKALFKLAEKHGFVVDTTEDASMFDEKHLKKYNVVVFLSTTGDILNGLQEQEFRRFIQAGGGFVGIHAAADTEYEWPWFGKLVGGYFNGHPNNPNVRQAIINRINKTHISTKMLPDRWKRNDEWYNYKNLNPRMNVLLNLDEKTYQGGTNGENHPISWAHEFDGGRAWYTGLGHTNETFEEELFLEHLWGGIQYAAGEGKPVDYDKGTVIPLENRFQKVVLESNLYEPMELVMLPDRSILYIQRRGQVRRYDPKIGKTETIFEIPVYNGQEDGLIGVTIDPNFQNNNWIYFFYSPLGNVAKQNVSRFTMNRDYTGINAKSEKVILEIKTQRDECCHSGGCLEFGPDGCLYISAGDDTNPFDSQGYAPIDEREGRKPWDAQRSSANSNDLRGKILRIIPKSDGSYDIPDGNLWPKDGSKGRPEIYVMGCRNPFRIAFDTERKHLYWGDVGPDAQNDKDDRGFRGHDEVNQARKAGFFGWPYFVGNNKPYVDYDFTKEKSSKPFNPSKPVNNSPNNTGSKALPTAQPAFIWYPYANSEEFPLVGTGGRNAMAAGVYYYDDYADKPGKFPKYYDGKLFTYDWIRGWMMAVTLDEEGNFVSMERFLPSYKFSNPTDIIFSPDGDMYILEYGAGWFTQNQDARLVHLKYNSGNRKPVAKITHDKQYGAVPFQVDFSAAASEDFDHDDLKYAWYFDSNKTPESTEKETSFTFTKPGKKYIRLEVTDNAGEKSEEIVEIYVGNSYADIDWGFKGNRSFYWDKQMLNYDIKVTDSEDSKSEGINPKAITVSIDYLSEGYDINEIVLGHQQKQEAPLISKGEQVMEGSDCKSCHKVNESSIGPSFTAVAKRYKDQKDAKDYLSNKIIQGGGGVWGETAMAAHPGISKEDAEHITNYILSLTNDQKKAISLPTKGSYTFKEHLNKGIYGKYVLTASYTDQGGQKVGPLTSTNRFILRNAKLMASDYNLLDKDSRKITLEPNLVPELTEKVDAIRGRSNSFVMYKNLDITNIQSIKLQYFNDNDVIPEDKIELRLNSPKGKLWGSLVLSETGKTKGLVNHQIDVVSSEGFHDIYAVFKSNDDRKVVCQLISLYFMNKDSQ